MPILTFPCPSCGLTFIDIKDLESHAKVSHDVSPAVITSPTDSDLKSYLKLISDQNKDLIDDMFELRKEMKRQYSDLQKEQERMKNDIRDLIDSHKVLESSSNKREEYILEVLEKRLDVIDNSMKVLEGNQVHLSQQVRDIPSSVSTIVQPKTKITSPSPSQQSNPARTCNKCDFIIHSDQHLRKHMKVRHGYKDKLLWVGDSINSNVDFNDISRRCNMEIFPAKAHAVTQESSNVKATEHNFLDVLEKELSCKEFNVLVIGGGTEEITNLDTMHAPIERLSEFKEIVVESSKKLFSLAEAALKFHPSLDKVILLKKPPRFDPISVDPMELKPQLSSMADSVLFEL